MGGRPVTAALLSPLWDATNMTIATALPRRRPRAIGLLLAAGLVVGGTYVAGVVRPTPAPVPTSAPAAQVRPAAAAAPIDGGGTPVGSLAQIDHSIDTWSKNLEANPRDFLAATNLAALYHGRGRLTYDLTDYERALTAARTALGIEPAHGAARALESTILFSLHDFSGAFATADGLVRDDPSQTGALATRFDAAVELGRIDVARADLDSLRDIGGPAVLIREARLASVTGDAVSASERARAARAAAVADEVDDMGFYAYAEGEYARLAGDAVAARAAFADALQLRDDDVGALVGLARIDAFEGHVDAAVAGLRRATDIAPQPEALALLGDLLEGQAPGTGTDAFETVRFIERLGDVQAATFDRQLLRFELDHGGANEAVLARARDSLAGRPDWTGHDTVAWTLYRLGQLDAAAESIAAARALGADDARLRFHDGAIQVARGDLTVGERLLRSALDLGPALDPIERAEATRLLGD
jgi:tetratricopeptide (TPR) repeat protein